MSDRSRRRTGRGLRTRGGDENLSGPTEMSRRDAIKILMTGTAALFLGAGCKRKPNRGIVSRVSGPEYSKIGAELLYASTWTAGDYPYGLIVKTVDGRPIKIDGNPDHPINRGSSSAAMQAAILSLYDPDRLRAPVLDGREVSWNEADRRIIDALRQASSIILLTRAGIGPSERALIEEWKTWKPGFRHFVHEAVNDAPRRSAWKKVYPKTGEPLPRFDRAHVVLSLDGDWIGSDGAALESIRHWAENRRAPGPEMMRVYAAESAMTVTGSNADHRIRIKPSAMGALVEALRAAVAGDSTGLSAFAGGQGLRAATLIALADDLRMHSGRAVVVAGGHLPESVHASVALLNDAIGAGRGPLAWNDSPPSLDTSDPREVEREIERGADVLIMSGMNPAYDWPGRDFRTLIHKARLAVGMGLYMDETLSACHAALPSHHFLESWNDAMPRDGIRSICQPAITPLFDSRQEAESLLNWGRALAGGQPSKWREYIKARWKATRGLSSWEDALRTGGHFSEHLSSLPAINRRAAETLARSSRGDAAIDLVILPHHGVHDGRFANNAWLQELPDPVSKAVWNSSASMSAKTATMIGAAEGDKVRLAVGDAEVTLPALIQPGTADGVIAITLGHGRTAGGTIAREAGGDNAARLMGRQDSAAPRYAFDVRAERAEGRLDIVRTQRFFSMEDRPLVLDATLAQYMADPSGIRHMRPELEGEDFNRPYDYSKSSKWGMVIDLASCMGCTACVVACQAENNIPVVGRKECANSREMHWLRIDRYHEGEGDAMKVHHQPVMCMHCGEAPCESVCPVNATTHGDEGLNEMAYNRCVGTRYCSNNCPYKVRHFNFLHYQENRLRDPVQELVFNPQVTVRGVGVMEKCTFCVQRINRGRIDALNRNARPEDGSIRTACQDACPAGAIVFGDMNDPKSRVATLAGSGRGFQLLESLQTRPSITYLARIRHTAAENPADGNAGKHGS